MEQNKLEEAVCFFRSEKGFQRLLEGIIKNYRRLGRLGGTVKLANLTWAEKEALSGLLGKDFSRQTSATLSLAKFQECLEKTRFAGVDLLALLEAYAGGAVLTKSEEKERYKAQKETFFQRLHFNHPHPLCRAWLEHIKTSGREAKLPEEQLNLVLQALVAAWGQKEAGIFRRLPVFAGLVANDPHAFDPGTELGRMLLGALRFVRSKGEKSLQPEDPQGAEEMTDLLAYFGILRDDLHNYVTCTGLVPYQQEEEPVAWWSEACRAGTVFNLPLREIVRYPSFRPFPGQKGNVVFAVENSGVFSEIVDYFLGKGLMAPPLICTNGQFKLAALYLLDRLVKNKTLIYYSGDFDPEGLQMAQRLYRRYPEQVRLWRYEAADYAKCPAEMVLSAPRLRKLDSITIAPLLPVKEALLSRGKAGYQEHLLQELMEDIESKFP